MANMCCTVGSGPKKSIATTCHFSGSLVDLIPTELVALSVSGALQYYLQYNLQYYLQYNLHYYLQYYLPIVQSSSFIDLVTSKLGPLINWDTFTDFRIYVWLPLDIISFDGVEFVSHNSSSYFQMLIALRLKWAHFSAG